MPPAPSNPNRAEEAETEDPSKIHALLLASREAPEDTHTGSHEHDHDAAEQSMDSDAFLLPIVPQLLIEGAALGPHHGADARADDPDRRTRYGPAHEVRSELS